MFLWLKTLYRKRAVTWPFIFYTIIWTLSNSNLVDIKLTTKPKIRKYWSKYLYFIESGRDGKIIKKPTNRLSVVIIIIVELVKQINPKYKWKDIQSSIRNLCKENDERAYLLGFNSLESAKNITLLIKNETRQKKA